MPSQINARLKEKGIILPEVKPPVANYVPFVLSGNTLYVSGQLPTGPDGQMVKGHLGGSVGIEKGQDAAKFCALNILAQANAALNGNLSRIKRVVKLGAFVASTPEFTDHSKVVNGASDFLVEALGEAGKHARFAVGVAALPLGAAIEIDAIFEITV